MPKRASETCLTGAIHKELLPTKKKAAGSSGGDGIRKETKCQLLI